MNEVTKPAATGIAPTMVERLLQGIAESRASTVLAGGGKPLLRMLKSGEWVFGQRDDEVQDGSTWAVNPLSIAHGWVAWTNHAGQTKNSMAGEVMVPVFEPKPVKPQPVDGWPFTEQRSFELKCILGDDEGVEVLYKTASLGGMNAVDALLGSIQTQIRRDPTHPCAVVTMGTDSYQHVKYGRIYTPIFTVVTFATMTGEPASVAETIPFPAAAKPAPEKPRKEPLQPRPTAAPVTVEAPVAPAPTAAARAGGSPRRRPTGR